MEIHSALEALVAICQIAGVGLPLLGILILSKKEQGQTTTNLMIATVGCLVMNSSNLLMLYAFETGEGMMSFKLKELGRILFCFFFAKFFLTYTGLIKKKLISWLMNILLACETLYLIVVWDDKRQAKLITHADFVKEKQFGVSYIQLQTSFFFQLRYFIICALFLLLLLISIRRWCFEKREDEKKKLLWIALAKTLVIIPFVLEMIMHRPFYFAPLLFSFAIMLIIVSVVRGDSYYLLDSGRNWAIENMNSIFIIVDKNFGYVDSNGLANVTFPKLRYALQGEQLSEELNALFHASVPEIKMGESIYEREMIPLDIDHKTKGYCLMLTDITKQYQFMEELKEAKLMAEEANRAKSDFISNMSHEIRTPMNAIVGITEILLRTETRTVEKGYLLNIKNSGAALLTIINDILDFSKIESGKLEILEEDYEPMSMLSDLSMIFMNRIGDKHIELLYDIDEKLPVKLFGDSLRIRQIIINIVNNAIKFTEEGFVKLAINMQDTDEENNILLHFSVTDTGQGIKEDDLGKLFGSFSQVDTKKNRNKEGTGLGLSISKQLVELMGGTIGVKSVYGKGSEFYFTIPQKVVKDMRAATIEETGEMTVSAYFTENILLEQVKKIAAQYDILYEEWKNDVEKKQEITYLFTDENGFMKLSKQDKEKIKNICILQNPMKAKHWDESILVVNKPLYTLNFCHIINQKMDTLVGDTIQNEYSFIAPEANILIVDDNEMNLKVARGLLEPLKMNIDTADSGQMAISMLQSKKYHLVFMDHMMPVMDGVETTEHIRNMEDSYYRDIPIIALSANAVSGAKEIFLEAGMNDFVPKPIEMNTICQQLKKWLPASMIQKSVTSTIHTEEQDIPEIPGLDVKEGIKNTGSVKLFISLLGDYYKVIDMKSQKLENCLQQHLIRDFTIEVHALKNTSRMIGAMELSQQFFTLEKLGNDENEIEINRLFPETLKLFQSYKDILEPFGKEEGIQKIEVDKEQIRNTLEKMRTSIDSFDLDTTDEMLKELETYKLPDEIEQKMDLLRALVADVDMEAIMELIDEMLTL